MNRVIDRFRALGPDGWLLAAGGLLILLLAAQAVRRVAAAGVGADLIRSSTAHKTAPARAEAKDASIYDEIAKNGHLGANKRPPKPQLFGILGDCALIGSSPTSAKPYRVGAQVPGGGKVAEIRLNEVVLDKDGAKQTLKVFADLPGQRSRPTPRPAPPAKPEAPATGAAPAKESPENVGRPESRIKESTP